MEWNLFYLFHTLTWSTSVFKIPESFESTLGEIIHFLIKQLFLIHTHVLVKYILSVNFIRTEATIKRQNVMTLQYDACIIFTRVSSLIIY